MTLQVPDQPLAHRILTGAVARAHVPQQFLLHGPAGTGKRQAAHALAHHLMGTPPEERDRPRLDLSVVRASGQQILLEDLEDALRDLASRPVVGRCRVVIVEGAERLNNPAVGSRLLKPLEEPPPGSHVVLVSDRVEDLLPTLRSRCVPVPFRSPGWRAVARRLQEGDLDADTSEALARSVGTQALGADPFFLAMHEIGVGVGLDMISGARSGGQVIAAAQAAMEQAADRNPSDELVRLRREAEALEGRRGGKTAAKKADDQARRERRRATTDGWGYVLAGAAGVVADALAVAIGAEGSRHPGLRARIAAIGPSAELCMWALEDIEHTRGELRLNPTVDVAARALMARIDMARAGRPVPVAAGRFPYL